MQGPCTRPWHEGFGNWTYCRPECWEPGPEESQSSDESPHALPAEQGLEFHRLSLCSEEHRASGSIDFHLWPKQQSRRVLPDNAAC